MKDLLLGNHVVVKTLNLEISRCSSAKYVTEFHQSACHTCSTIIFPHPTNHSIVFWHCLCRCRHLCLSFLMSSVWKTISGGNMRGNIYVITWYNVQCPTPLPPNVFNCACLPWLGYRTLKIQPEETLPDQREHWMIHVCYHSLIWPPVNGQGWRPRQFQCLCYFLQTKINEIKTQIKQLIQLTQARRYGNTVSNTFAQNGWSSMGIPC